MMRRMFSKRLAAFVESALRLFQISINHWLLRWPGHGWYSIGPGEPYDFQDVHMIDATTGFAVGTRGIIFKTADGGQTWQSLVSPVSVDLHCVFFTGASRGFAVGDNFTVLRTTDGGLSWYDPRSDRATDPNICLRGIFFLDDNNGFLVGGRRGVPPKELGLILRTKDSGVTWEWVALPTGVPALAALDFFDSLTGEAVGGTSYYFAGSYYSESVLLRTTDGGQTWAMQNDPRVSPGNIVSYGYSDVETHPSGHAVAVGGGTADPILSMDGGASWNRAAGACGEGGIGLVSLSFAGTDTVVGVGGDGCSGAIERSTNVGGSWSLIDSGSFPQLMAVSFGDQNVGVAVGQEATALRSNDGGRTWVSCLIQPTLPQAIRNSTGLNVVQFINETIGFVGTSYTTLLKTADSGLTWKRVGRPVTIGGINDLWFFDEQHGIAIGGFLARTEDGGNTWREYLTKSDGHTYFFQPLGSRFSGIATAIHFADAVHGALIGRQRRFRVTAQTAATTGFILRTSDGGLSWTETVPPQNPHELWPEDVFWIGPQVGVVVGTRQTPSGPLGIVLRTGDGGQNWTEQTLEKPNSRSLDATAAYFATPNIGYIAAFPHIFKTVDGGVTWVPTETSPPCRFFSLFFTTPDIGWAVGYYSSSSPYFLRAAIYQTDDGGRTWDEQDAGGTIIRDVILRSVAFANNEIGVAVGDAGTLLRTASAGI